MKKVIFSFFIILLGINVAWAAELCQPKVDINIADGAVNASTALNLCPTGKINAVAANAAGQNQNISITVISPSNPQYIGGPGNQTQTIKQMSCPSDRSKTCYKTTLTGQTTNAQGQTSFYLQNTSEQNMPIEAFYVEIK